ncbi:MAG TPA: oligosaccharide flippase family protein [Candidatus Moranbacteria bacterium]|nr:oligosaccharide flippase family protein [Candidatus Moranbacteria bacterium]HRZ33332.1 oligosaccharide flippase family protein [Candidatus Moranbacteria bacterium]
MIRNILLKYGEKIGIDLPYFVKHGFFATMRQIVDLLAGLLLAIMFARFATKDVFGHYQFVIAIFSIVSILSLPGLNTSVARSAAIGKDGDYKNAVKKSFIYSLWGIPILFIIGVFYYLTQSQELGIAFAISSFFFPLFYAPNTWGSFLQGKGRFDVFFKFGSTQSIINAIITSIVVFLNQNNLLPIIFTYFITYTIFNAAYYFKSFKYVENDEKDPDAIKYGKFLTIMNIFQLLAENVDKIIVGLLMPASSLAVYGVISMIPVRLKNVFGYILNITFSKIASKNIDIKDLFKSNKKLPYIILFMSILIGLIYYVLIEKISYLFFGNGYSDFYQYSKIFTVFMMLLLPYSLLYIYANAKKMVKLIKSIYPFFFFIKLIVTVIFVYFWGLVGAVIAYNINAFILICLYLIYINRDSKKLGTF